MEIKINIPQNDYVQPTEVREEIVQLVCDAIVNMANEVASLDIQTEKRMGICINTKNHWLYGVPDDGSYTHSRGVRTCEMEAAFKIVQNAGYYIYPTRCVCPSEYSFTFSKKPYLNGWKAQRVTFDLFID